MITAWPLADPLYPTLDAQGSDVFAPRSFQPDVGPPITRPATTADLEAYDLSAVLHSRADLATLLDWWRVTLARGTLPFIWRHPRTRDVVKFRFNGPIQHVQLSAERVRVTFSALRLPGVPWFAPYVPGGGVRLPAFVADYAGGVYGVGDARGVAGDLSAISGTFEVWRKTTSGTQTFLSQTYSSDVPTSAPTGVAWLVGFAP